MFDAPPNSLINSTANPKVKSTRIRSWGTFPNSQHFEGKGACWSSKRGTKTSDKRVNYSHRPA
jgi:hypothetical protein